jgi:hypothetical protein
MNRFTIIVMTDSREDSDAVVSAVSALGRDKEAPSRRLRAARGRATAAAPSSETTNERRPRRNAR